MKDDGYKQYNKTNSPKENYEVVSINVPVYQNRIVAAAIKVTLKPFVEGGDPIEIIIVSPRHFDNVMKRIYNALEDRIIDKGHDKQGFVDMYGNWHDREAALKIAIAANQILGNKLFPENELHSEDLYRNEL